MKKILLSLFLCALFSVQMAFSQGFEVGTNEVSLGLGLGSSLNALNSSGSFPGINFQYERGMWKAGENGVIGLGGFLGYKNYNYNGFLGTNTKFSINYIIIGARGAYHYTGIENGKWDPYGGVMISYNIASSSYKDSYGGFNDFSAASNASFSVYAGLRYLFNEKFGVYGELGYGISILNLGGSLKF